MPLIATDCHCTQHLEAAFNGNDPAKLVARALLVQTHRNATRLRAVVGRLEHEASLAQSTHVADVRSLSDRLVARHEAHQALLLVELERADFAWASAVSALEGRMTDIRRSWASEVHARDLELHRRQAQLDALATKLEEVEERRTFESRIAATDGRTLKAEVVRLEQALDTARLEHGRLEKEKQKLIVQCVNQSADASAPACKCSPRRPSLPHRCVNQSADAGSANAGLQQLLRQEQQARAEMQERADGLLAIEKEQRRAREIELQHEIARERKASEVREAHMLKAYTALQEDKAAMELTLNTKLKRLETIKEQEKAVLRARVDRLSKLQEEAINAGGAQKTRALLWHAALKSKTQAEDSISWRGENSPALNEAPRWKAQQWAEQQFAEQQWAESASSSTAYGPEDGAAAAAAVLPEA